MAQTDIAPAEYDVHAGNAPFRLTVQVPWSNRALDESRIVDTAVREIPGIHWWAGGAGLGYRDEEYDVLSREACDAGVAKAAAMLTERGYDVKILGPDATDNDDPPPTTAIVAWALNVPDAEDTTHA